MVQLFVYVWLRELIDKTAESNALLHIVEENQKKIIANLSGESIDEDEGYAT